MEFAFNCAIVPTTISDKADEMRSQIESSVAIKARPTQSAARAQIPVMIGSPGSEASFRRDLARRAPTLGSPSRCAQLESISADDRKAGPHLTDDPTSRLPRLFRVAGVISLNWRFWGIPSPSGIYPKRVESVTSTSRFGPGGDQG